jgi:hypothetical protein
MTAIPDKTAADPQQIIAELERKLDERTATFVNASVLSYRPWKCPACLIRFLLAAYRCRVFKRAAMIFVPCPRIPCMAQERVCAPVLLVAILPMEIRCLHRLDI